MTGERLARTAWRVNSPTSAAFAANALEQPFALAGPAAMTGRRSLTPAGAPGTSACVMASGGAKRAAHSFPPAAASELRDRRAWSSCARLAAISRRCRIWAIRISSVVAKRQSSPQLIDEPGSDRLIKVEMLGDLLSGSCKYATVG
ncbi:hypothetical protein DIJ63_35795 [Burkholderia pseudomallei]|nr:hypothetical protein CF640_34695 [Burkholderia pseudomallei]PNX14732.1 hypothetical protein CF645_35805 [Burkholderia pseudomallei]QBI42784.1 hypothetical protein EXY28_23880 [Burkholderia pseudomallei]QBI49457.1 hypothetical protein EXY72_23945 [Burkholderia pseudomallei]QBP51192.1 hypothetical protein E2R28_23640 [Burkholderia pseudomallei]